MTLTVLLWVLAVVLVLAGLAGMVLPALPGAPLLFAGLLAAAWAEDFAYVGTKTLIALGVMATLSYALDFAATALGARRFGASSRAIAGAALGTVVGLFFGLPGLVLGPFLGAMAGELTARRDLQAAAGAGVGAFLGLLLATAGKLALGFAMLGLFLLVRFL
ncbi:MAG: hypothetical protein A2150_05920 [Candidatus Muproteobacteria bacterium RBG_16_64_11]|uniref:DUF456 domain-containing protein n=1 Tax=Candidatus Muproteobacteria bacterium RBG_16_64_11 TaxID=1817758 RepID=A0A1F6TI53_9PROT|nr:MAG: hypothetical protein A2150_05920 [Candidatus Muproteobacteria bacterium RBG_16_64_11]